MSTDNDSYVILQEKKYNNKYNKNKVCEWRARWCL